MKEKKTILAVTGVILLPPVLLILLLTDLLHPLPSVVLDCALVMIFLLYGLCADLYTRTLSGKRHKAPMQSLNAVFYFLWMVVLARIAVARPGLRHLPLVTLLFALALVLFVLSLRRVLLIRSR